MEVEKTTSRTSGILLDVACLSKFFESQWNGARRILQQTSYTSQQCPLVRGLQKNHSFSFQKCFFAIPLLLGFSFLEGKE
jgi:hypothetical protein